MNSIPFTAVCSRVCLRSARVLHMAAWAWALSATPALADAAWRFASAAPPGSIFATQVERLVSDIAAETKDAIKIEPHHNSELGKEADVIAQIARGRLEMGGFAATALSLQVPEIALLQMPFYFDSFAQRDCVLDRYAQPLVAEALSRKGLKFLAWGESGTSQLIGRKAYTSPADVRGIRMGVFASNALTKFWRNMGAMPVFWKTDGKGPRPIASPDLPGMFQSDEIDAWVTVPVFYVPSGLNKSAPVMSKVDINISLTVNVMNKAAYDNLPAHVRGDLDRGVARTPTAVVRKEIRQLNEVLYKVHVDKGGTLAVATPAQRQQWQQDLAPMWAAMAEDLGSGGQKLFAAMESGKRECARFAN